MVYAVIFGFTSIFLAFAAVKSTKVWYQLLFGITSILACTLTGAVIQAPNNIIFGDASYNLLFWVFRITLTIYIIEFIVKILQKKNIKQEAI